MKLFGIPMVMAPRKTKIILFAKKQNNIQTFFNLHIHTIQSFFSVGSTFLKKSLFDFFSRKNRSRKVSISFTSVKGFSQNHGLVRRQPSPSRKTWEWMLRHRPVYWDDCRVVWILRTTWCHWCHAWWFLDWPSDLVIFQCNLVIFCKVRV